MSLALYLVVMAGTTYLVRMIPFTAFRKQIRSRFLQSFLFYVPYAVLGAMTFPAIFYSTGNTITAVVGTAVALALAFLKQSLVVVAIGACVAALLTGLII